MVEDTVSLGKIFHIKWESKLKYFRYCDCFALQCIEQWIKEKNSSYFDNHDFFVKKASWIKAESLLPET